MFMVLAAAGTAAGIYAWFQGAGTVWLIGALFLAAMFPITAIFIVPLNLRLLRIKPGDTAGSDELFARWARLHAFRTVIGGISFVLFASALTFK